MRAAEKYAELEAAGLERPRCKCHGLEMQWNKKKVKAGGYWKCLIVSNEKQLLWYHSQPLEERHKWRKKNPEKVKDINREASRRRRGWYDEGGMATKPMQVPKELM